MRNYDLRLKQYDISPARYRELKAFCEQYHEKRSKLNQIYTLSSVPFDAPTQGGMPGNPTEQKAIKAQYLHRDIKLIDDTIAEAVEDPTIRTELKRNVTQRCGYDSLAWMPCGRRQFFDFRRMFFVLLNDKI